MCKPPHGKQPLTFKSKFYWINLLLSTFFHFSIDCAPNRSVFNHRRPKWLHKRHAKHQQLLSSTKWFWGYRTDQSHIGNSAIRRCLLLVGLASQWSCVIHRQHKTPRNPSGESINGRQRKNLRYGHFRWATTDETTSMAATLCAGHVGIRAAQRFKGFYVCYYRKSQNICLGDLVFLARRHSTNWTFCAPLMAPPLLPRGVSLIIKNQKILFSRC